MSDTYEVTIPVWYDRAGERRGGQVFAANLVAEVPAKETPNADDVRLWYGPDAPRAAFRASPNHRRVFQRIADGAYVIIPSVPRNAGLVRLLEKADV